MLPRKAEIGAAVDLEENFRTIVIVHRTEILARFHFLWYAKAQMSPFGLLNPKIKNASHFCTILMAQSSGIENCFHGAGAALRWTSRGTRGRTRGESRGPPRCRF